jgi:hypothetical protein
MKMPISDFPGDLCIYPYEPLELDVTGRKPIPRFRGLLFCSSLLRCKRGVIKGT